MLDVSILIVNWNTCEITLDCLQSVYEQTTEITFEVIVVDNASSDDSVQRIEAEFPHARRFELSTGHLSVRNLHFYRRLGYQDFKTIAVSPTLSFVYLHKLRAPTEYPDG